MTSGEAELYLTDPDWRVRLAWAIRTDYEPTERQIKRGLADEESYVRDAWATRSHTHKENEYEINC